jgi:hypothetical protein
MALLVGGAVLLVLGAIATWRPDLPARVPAAVVPVAAGIAAVGMALGESAPTGWEPFDLLLRAATGAAAVLAASRLRVAWTVWVAAAALGVVVVADAGGWEAATAAGAAVALVLAVAIGRQPGLQAFATAGAVVPLAHLQWPLAAHVSSVAVAVVLVPLLLAGLVRSPRRFRRTVAWSLAGVALVVLVGAVAGGLAALQARRDVDRAVDAAEAGLDGVSDEDTGPAIEQLREAEAAFESADRTLRAWWAKPALLVPGVAQQARAVATMADAGAELSDVAATSLEQVDLDRLQPSGGQVDLAAIDAVADPLQDAAAVLRRSDGRLRAVSSPMLLPPVADRLEALSTDVADARQQADTAAAAIEVAPDLLGADEPRRYFLVMHTPSELRGAGGFMGSWGELVIDDGRFELARTGRLRELIEGGPDPAARRIEGEAEFVRHWGQDPAIAWGTIAFSPDFPTVARIISQLYPQSGGQEVDGVIALDPSAFASLLEITGPVSVPGTEARLVPKTAEEYLLHGQYLEFEEDDREGFLTAATEALFEELTAGDLPSPRVIGEELGPAVAGRHLQLFSLDDDEQRFFTCIDADGSARRTDADDAIGVVGQNYNGNKIDYFLRRRLTYDVTWDPDTGELEGAVEVLVRNLAPADGLPDSVIRWGGDVSRGQVPVADGENFHLLSLYSGFGVDDLTVDGEAASLQWDDEDLGYRARDLFVRVPAGAERLVRGTVRGVIDPGRAFELEVLRQPTAVPDEIVVRVRLADGWELPGGGSTFEWDGDTTVPIRLSVDAEPAAPTVLERLEGTATSRK